jgi:hypothetical protein
LTGQKCLRLSWIKQTFLKTFLKLIFL